MAYQPMFLDLRVDPAHARAAGFKVVFSPSSNVCDFCGDRIHKRLTLRPMPIMMLDPRTLLYYPAEWTLCRECYAVRDDSDSLLERQRVVINSGVGILGESHRNIVIVNAVHALRNWELAHEHYRPRGEAILMLEQASTACKKSQAGDYSGFEHLSDLDVWMTDAES